ncbi:MAG: hypothetical protein GY788_16540 [bacterium]|nr:hypothetical protein [bacterium]
MIDRTLHACQAQATFGVSPMAIIAAQIDWLMHLANAPGKQAELFETAFWGARDLFAYGLRSFANPKCRPLAEPPDEDRRFQDPAWSAWPFNVMAQSHLLAENWWNEATAGVNGMTRQHAREIDYITRQSLDRIAPSNSPWTNPEVIRRSFEEGGVNLWRGTQNLFEDLYRQGLVRTSPTSEFSRLELPILA